MNEAPTGRLAHIKPWLLGALLVGGVVVRLVSAPYLHAPFPVDATYYTDVAKSLALGRGLTIDYLWMYDRGVPDRLPMPSNGYWMPGMSLYLWPWFRLLGPSFAAGQFATIVLGVPFLLLVWRVAREVTGRELPALFAVALAAVDPVCVVASITSDAILLQGLLMGTAILCLLRGLQRDPRWLWAAGLLAGCGHLVRNDGALILPVVVLCVFLCRPRGRPVARLAHALYFLLPYALVIGPWLLRNQLVFGAPSPPQLFRLAFLPRYEDIFRADLSSITVRDWLTKHHGWAGVVRYDLLVLYRIAEWLLTKGANSLLLFAVPFLCRDRSAAARPFLLLLGLIALAYSFVIPEVGIKGGITRSFITILPLLFAAAAGGVWLAGEWAARRWPQRSRPLLTATLGLLLLAHTAVRLGDTLARVHQEISASPCVMDANLLRGFFATHGPADQPVLAEDPWQFHAVTGRPCLMIPTDGQTTLMEVARRLRVRYLVMPGAFRRTYPGFQEALDREQIAAVREMPTLAAYAGLQIFDLQAGPLLAEGRRLNQAGRDAARRGDYAEAEARFEAALKLLAEYPRPAEVLRKNLAQARAAARAGVPR